MQRLTKAEEEVMQHIWDLGRCTVRNILDQMGTPKPPHSTISSIVRILETKGFLDHKAYGRTYEYFPIILRADYSKKSVKKLVSDYFDGSPKSLVSFLLKEEKIDLEELKKMVDEMENDESDSKNLS